MRFILSFAILAFASHGILGAVVGKSGYEPQFKRPPHRQQQQNHDLSTQNPNSRDVEDEEFNFQQDVPQFRHHHFGGAAEEPQRLFPLHHTPEHNEDDSDDMDDDNDDQVEFEHRPRGPRSFGYHPSRGRRSFGYYPARGRRETHYVPQGPGQPENRNDDVPRKLPGPPSPYYHGRGRRSFGYYPARGRRSASSYE
uniref:Uncharacterized protein n=1 Tax=Panagrolaimus sp. ES5 TaxID=591445 RepID=A0AC34GV09_9BILA